MPPRMSRPPLARIANKPLGRYRSAPRTQRILPSSFLLKPYSLPILNPQAEWGDLYFPGLSPSLLPAVFAKPVDLESMTRGLVLILVADCLLQFTDLGRKEFH